MVERKTKRNGQPSKKQPGFRIRSEPVVRISSHGQSSEIARSVTLPRVYDRPILFVIAQDEHTIFASWNVDWQRVFQTATPADRQVYLRVVDSEGIEQKKVAVEPLAGMDYVTLSGQRDSYRVEIGYYQPAETWHSIAISDAVTLPSRGTAKIADADLVTIPIHLRFQKLLDIFGVTNAAPLAKALSTLQNRVLTSQPPNESSLGDRQILEKLDLSLPEIANARSDFEKSKTEKLARRAALVQSTATSPSHGFQMPWTSAGS